jgi:uncharacterized membrane protein SpoIIM required for sporulation
MLSPGFMTRRDSLTESAALAIRLLLGVIPMLVVAGLIEGFVSPSDIPVTMKFALGASALILLGGYLFMVRGATTDSVPSR